MSPLVRRSTAPQKWRWDQGRLTYFQFENLKNIARCLVLLGGTSLDRGDDPLRAELEKLTGLPFAPNTYKVWRNYKRVFECAFLATNLDGTLYITDFCKRLALEDSGEMDVDEFLSLFIPKFRYPFPAFSEYEENAQIVYPFSAVLKKLLSDFLIHKRAVLSLEDVFSLIVGNNCSGLEPLEHYATLTPTGYVPDADEKRQVREMLIFISQLSILKWYDGELHLDISVKDYEDYNGFETLITPVLGETRKTREEEFISVTSLTGEVAYTFKLQSREMPTDDIFIEGKRTRVTHIKIERSPLLRRLFLKTYPGTTCNMCTADMKYRYPWTDNLLEIHHLLPLSSALSITNEGTSLADVVGICPNCHKSTHSYYRKWLNENNLDDFRSKDEAKEIYGRAKKGTILV